MFDKITFIHKNGIWSPTSLPPGKSTISTKWMYKAKQWAIGKILKCKAYLVARGFEQYEGIDYEETFAPVVNAKIYMELHTCILFLDFGKV